MFIDEKMLSTSDGEAIEKIILTTREIVSRYELLTKLEKNGKKESPTYELCLQSLQKFTKKEQDIYDRKVLSIQGCEFLFQRLVEKYNSNNNSDKGFIEILMNSDINLISERIMARLSTEIFKPFAKEEASKQFCEKNEYPIDSSIFNEILDINEHFNDIIDEKFLETLNNDINDESCEFLRDDLIEAKYKLICLKNNTEKIFLTGKGKKRFVKDSMIDIAKDVFEDDIYETQETELLNIRNEDYSYGKNALLAKFRQNLIMSVLSIMEEEKVKKLCTSFYEKVSSPNYLIDHEEDSLSEDIIACAFKQVQDNKSKKLK